MKDHVLLEVNGRSVLGLVKHQRETGFAGEAQLSTACDVMLENVLDEALKSSDAIILKFALFNKSPPKPQPQVFHPVIRQEVPVRYTSTNPLHDEMNRPEVHDGQTRTEHAASVVGSLDYYAGGIHHGQDHTPGRQSMFTRTKSNKAAHRHVGVSDGWMEQQQQKDVRQVLAESKNETTEEEDAKPHSRPINAASSTSPPPKVVKKQKRKTFREQQSKVERQVEMTSSDLTNKSKTKVETYAILNGVSCTSSDTKRAAPLIVACKMQAAGLPILAGRELMAATRTIKKANMEVIGQQCHVT
jgi:hypothetical protein